MISQLSLSVDWNVLGNQQTHDRTLLEPYRRRPASAVSKTPDPDVGAPISLDYLQARSEPVLDTLSGLQAEESVNAEVQVLIGLGCGPLNSGFQGALSHPLLTLGGPRSPT